MLMGVKTRFCPVCGREQNRLVDGTCADCYFKSVEIRLPKEIEVQACPVCDSIRVKGFWVKSDEDHDNFLIQAIIDKIKLPTEVELEDIEILQRGKEGRIQINIDIAGKRFSIVKAVELHVTDKLCDEDSKRKREAYEGILQLRAENNPAGFIHATEKFLQPFSSNILKVEEQRNGADVYFLDKETMRQALSVIKKKFPLYIKESAKAYSWEKTKSRPKFKVTILARLRD
jgi:NMD protein affecting ribosome stability and mRNA decay